MALWIFLLLPVVQRAAATTTINCTALPPSSPTWRLEDWFTDFSTPDGGAVIFRLANLVTGFDSLCFRRGLAIEGQCIWTAGGEEVDDETETWFSFDEGTGELRVYQRWSCLDHG